MRSLLALIMALQLTALLQAQSSLVSLAREAGVDWLLGEWEGSGDNGDVIQTAFRPELNDHIVIVTYKDSRSEAKGMIMVEPGTEQAKYCTADNQGGVGDGIWSVEEGKIILRYRYVSPEQETRRMAIVFTKLASDRMDVAIHELDSGNVVGASRWNTEFKRKK
jgi:hypothetical protein